LENLEEKSELFLLKWKQKYEQMRNEIIQFHEAKRVELNKEKEGYQAKLAEYKRTTQDFTNSTSYYLLDEKVPPAVQSNSKFEKYIDFSEVIASSQQSVLKTIDDIAHCQVEGSNDCFVNKEYRFILRATSKRGNIVPLTFNPFRVTLASVPNGNLLPTVTTALEGYTIMMTFSAKAFGAYKLQIFTRDKLVNPAHHIYVSTDIIERVVLPTPCWYGGSFNPLTHEFWIKSSYTNRQVLCYDKKGVKKRSFDLPCDCVFLTCDLNGDVYVGNGSKEYIRLDKDLKILWTLKHDKKPAYPITSDGVCVYAYTHGFISLIDKWRGLMIETIKLSHHVDEVCSLIYLMMNFTFLIFWK
jgi:hypothetical protein